MTKEREALQMCLEYIETNAHERKYVRHAIKAALAQPVQEPDALTIAYQSGFYDGKKAAQRPWVGLTDEEIDHQAKKDDHGAYFALGALWAEAKLKERNS